MLWEMLLVKKIKVMIRFFSQQRLFAKNESEWFRVIMASLVECCKMNERKEPM